MQDLGTLGTGNDAFAAYINEVGQVAGYSFTNTTPNSRRVPNCGNNSFVPTADPFFWENGTMTDIGTLGGTCGIANGLNNPGQVIGQSYLAGDNFAHPFLWDKVQGLRDLGTLGGNFGNAIWLNDTGDVAGYANLLNGLTHAVLWSHGQVPGTDLGVIPGDGCSFARSINSQGQVVGGSGHCGQISAHPVLWENGGPLVDLNTLLPPHPGIQLAGDEAYIDDQGEILVDGTISNGDHHAFLLIPN
jgi:probable HAF family extracellular repeat protein